MTMSEKQKMLAGELYRPGDPEILADQAAAKAWMVRYNAALAASPDERRALLAERLASVGAGAVIRPPFHCDYGYNIHLGEGAFLNFNCVILDVVEVHIGAGAQIGPAVQLYTADHPRAGRRRGARQPGASALTGSLARSTPSLGGPPTPALYARTGTPPEDVATACRT